MVKAYQGIHGTCQTWGEQIVTNGFIPLPGKLGIGNYFWRYYEQDAYAKFLAFRWWQYKFKKGDYNQENVKSKKCVILNCYFHIEDEATEVLDLSDGAVKEQLIDFIKIGTQQITQDRGSQNIDNRINELIAAYIDIIEQIQNAPIKIIISDLAIPKGSGGMIGKCFGAAAEAIIVRDLSCINIENIEEIDYNEYDEYLKAPVF